MLKPDATDETLLLQQLHKGDYAAFEKLYDKYAPRLAANLMKLLKSADLVDEALQELFIKVWENHAKIDPGQPIKGYLFRIAENLVIDIYRKAARDIKMRRHFIAFAEDAYDHIEKDIWDAENRALLQRAIDLLPPQQRKVYILCKLEEKSYKEVSELLGISQAAVNKHISKANLFLRNYYAHSALVTLLIFDTISGRL